MYFLPLFINFLISFHTISPKIVFPFVINSLKDQEYNATKLFDDYFVRDFYTTITMGSSPSQEILTVISSEYHLFSLSEEICEKKTVNYINNESIAKKSGFYLEKATSYKNITSYMNAYNKYKDGEVIQDIFSFYNTTYLKCQPASYKNKNINSSLIDSKTNITSSNIILYEVKNGKNCANIGLNSPFTYTYDVSLLKELKKSSPDNVKDYSFTFKFLSKNEGQLIIGELPHEYENDKTKNDDNYITVKANGMYNIPWVFTFKKIYYENKNKEIEILYGYLEKSNILMPNIGFIIADDKYKELIKQDYFDDLIKDNICEIETVIYNITNVTKSIIEYIKYDIFSCNKKNFTNDKKNNFPTLYFSHIGYNFTFSLTNTDLFLEIGEKVYFLVIFPYSANNYWYLGLPFIQKYQFVFNHDSKTIGFYTYEEKNNESGGFEFKYWRLILEILGAVILGVIVFFVAKKLYEQRKKRANELADDDFDYKVKSEEKDKLEDSTGFGIN